MSWTPASIDQVEEIVQADLTSCNEQERAGFERYAVPPFVAPILRYGQLETVVVVARKSNEVLYWEDVEEGFNTSRLSEDGRIVEHWCNQDGLALAIRRWL